jgi:hypothetical protein
VQNYLLCFLLSTARILMEKEAVCANNCPSVDPNPVVVGGTALVLASVVTAVTAGNLLGPMLGAGSILAAIGLGMVAMPHRRGACPPGQCRSVLRKHVALML